VYRTLFQRLLNNLRNRRERNSLIQECLHRHFIGCIQNGRSSATTAPGACCQLQTGIVRLVRGFELHTFNRHQIKSPGSGFDTLGPSQCMTDGNAHIRTAHLRQHRTILIFNQ
jgi:hypothetical protein